MRKLALGALPLGVLALATQVDAANIFLSTVTTPPTNSDTSTGVVEDLNPTITFGSTGVKTLGIWVTDEVVVNRGLSMNITTSNNAVAPLTGAQALNFDVRNVTYFAGTENDSGSTGINRWGSVGTGSLQPGGTAINNINATTVNDGRGINNANNGAPAPVNFASDTWDVGYDVPSGAFLYGTVSFNLTDLQTQVIIDLTASNLGIATNPGGDVTSQFSFGQATINAPVVEEISQVALGAALPGTSNVADNTPVSDDDAGPTAGAVTVSGASGFYVAEIDGLTTDTNSGHAEVDGVSGLTDNPAGAPIYVGLWLLDTNEGGGSTIAGLLADLDAASGATYDVLLPGSFPASLDAIWGDASAVLRFNSYGPLAGADVFSWDFDADTDIVMDKVSLIPEPASLGLLALGALAMLRRRK
jgi:hypothetical protein